MVLPEASIPMARSRESSRFLAALLTKELIVAKENPDMISVVLAFSSNQGD